MKWRLWSLLAVVVGVAAASCSTSSDDGCQSAYDCPSAQICVAGECVFSCNSNDDCAALQECADGACRDLALCTTASECPHGYYCADGTTCRPMLALGAPCSATGVPCASGHCVDGMCCDGPCGGPCQRCEGGRCEPYDAGSDPEEECPGLAACDADSVCATLGNGSTCDIDAACTSGFCANDVCCEERCGAVCEACDQEGRCRSILNAEDSGICDATTLGGACSHLPCACDGDGRCHSAGGAFCELGTQCVSNACIDQACCAEACVGACSSCAEAETGVAGGFCEPVLEGRDPREGCAGVLSCDGAGGCESSWAGIKQLDSDGNERAMGIATDSTGNVYVTGYTNGELDAATAVGETDAFVAKYSRTGELVWIRQIGTDLADEAWCIDIDGADNLYLVGSTATHLEVGVPVYDVYIVKLDSDGNDIWSRAIGTDVTDRATGCHVDAGGNVFAAGSSKGVFAGAAYHGGFSDAIALGLDANGDETWRQQLGTSGLDVAHAIATDANGIAYVAGSTFGTLGDASRGSNDFFVAAINMSENKVLWTLQDGTAEFDSFGDLVLDDAGTAYVAGTTLGAFPGFSNPSAMNDVFVARYDLTTAARSWVRQFGSMDSGGGTDVDDEGTGLLYASGGVYITGNVGGTLPNAAWSGLTDLFLGRLNGVGEITWLRQAGTTGSDYGNALAANADGDVFAACHTNGSFPGNDVVSGQAACVVKYNNAGEVQ